MRGLTYFFRSLLLAVCVTVSAVAVSAQVESSLIFSDTKGQRVAFTNFGTIVYPNQSIVSRGYGVVYGGGLQAYYLNSSYNSRIRSVSLSADQPNGKTLKNGERVYVRAVVRTEDNRLTITHRYIWRVGSSGIEAVVTVRNNSTSPIDVKQVFVLTPVRPSTPGVPLAPDRLSTPDQSSPQGDPTLYSCHCAPVVPFDDSMVDTTQVTIPPNQSYDKTTATYPDPTLEGGGSVDAPGCDPVPWFVNPSSAC